MVCRVAPLVLLWQATSCSLGTHEAGMLNKKNKFAHRAPRAEKPPTTRRAIQNVASRRQVRHPFDKRLQQAAAAWEGYSPGVAPDIVMTSSLLWDVARIHGSQPAMLEDPAGLPLSVLRSWAVNYTGVVAFAMRTFPQVRPRCLHSLMSSVLSLPFSFISSSLFLSLSEGKHNASDWRCKDRPFGNMVCRCRGGACEVCPASDALHGI